MMLPFIFVIFLFILNIFAENYSYIDLPKSHLVYYFNKFPKLAEICLKKDEFSKQQMTSAESNGCLDYQRILSENPAYNPESCWGYESDCTIENRFSSPICTSQLHSVSEEQILGYVHPSAAIGDVNKMMDTFYNEADFGYIKQQLDSLMLICGPQLQSDASLECTKYLRFCRGRNIIINFENLLKRAEPVRYSMDVLDVGQIGGHCKLYQERLSNELSHMSSLQSWAPELKNFAEYPYHRILDTTNCDIIIDKPTFIMKIDANINMYHHFCDFFNLYATLHMNFTHPTTFSTDINILIWETYDYDSPFRVVFKAFTQNPILDLKQFRGERVCFRNLVMPLLPRMIFGLYYNTPIISGCEKSGLFQAFSDHILHRLHIPLYRRFDNKIRITILERQTKYRRILNIDELVLELERNESYDVRKVNFEWHTNFLDQLEVTRNTDIFIGMHGAGLTHLLFLPNWAGVFEVYHCEDPTCYADLARLRGVFYQTWENDTKFSKKDEDARPDVGGAHAKFTNYLFERTEFIRLVNKLAEKVRNHKEFIKFLMENNQMGTAEINKHNEL